MLAYSALTHSQDFTVVSNVEPRLPTTCDQRVRIADVHYVPSYRQSNSSDCGCHCIMMMRALVVHAAQLTDQLTWRSLQLPSAADSQRDAAWRAQIAQECIALRIELQGGGGTRVVVHQTASLYHNGINDSTAHLTWGRSRYDRGNTTGALRRTRPVRKQQVCAHFKSMKSGACSAVCAV